MQQVQQKLPEGVENPQISPISSPIGTVLQYAFTAETTPLMEVRRLVDRDVTNRLLAVPGISQVIAYGGDIRQYQILVNPAKLKAFNVTLDEVTSAARGANVNAAGGFLVNPDQELIIRGLGRIESIEQLGKSAITARNGTPVLLQDVADVSIGAALKRGDGSLDGQPAIVVMVNKQPQNDTPTVTKAVENAIAEIKVGLPKVQDTGIGIQQPEITRIFDRFYRVNSDRSRSTGGSGLGLAIAQAIIQAHHGSIDMQSEFGKGSTFTIKLPFDVRPLDSVRSLYPFKILYYRLHQ